MFTQAKKNMTHLVGNICVVAMAMTCSVAVAADKAVVAEVTATTITPQAQQQTYIGIRLCTDYPRCDVY